MPDDRHLLNKGKSASILHTNKHKKISWFLETGYQMKIIGSTDKLSGLKFRSQIFKSGPHPVFFDSQCVRVI